MHVFDVALKGSVKIHCLAYVQNVSSVVLVFISYDTLLLYSVWQEKLVIPFSIVKIPVNPV